MKEYVGACVRCGVKIYCMDGFLNGTVAENGELYCFECHDKRLENTENRQGAQRIRKLTTLEQNVKLIIAKRDRRAYGAAKSRLPYGLLGVAFRSLAANNTDAPTRIPPRDGTPSSCSRPTIDARQPSLYRQRS